MKEKTVQEKKQVLLGEFKCCSQVNHVVQAEPGRRVSHVITVYVKEAHLSLSHILLLSKVAHITHLNQSCYTRKS